MTTTSPPTITDTCGSEALAGFATNVEDKAADRLTELYNCVLPSYMSKLHVYQLNSSAHL